MLSKAWTWREERMRIKRLNDGELSRYEEDIRRLLRVGYTASFHCEPAESYINKKIGGLENFLRDGSAIVFIVVNQRGRLMGYLWAFRLDTLHGTRLHVQHIAVMPEFQGCGIGKMLMGELEKEACQQGVAQIELIVSSCNQGAVAFYNKIDFTVERCIMTKRVSR